MIGRMNVINTSQEWLDREHLHNPQPRNSQNLEMLGNQEEDGLMIYEESCVI
jgi:hypothetical protein